MKNMKNNEKTQAFVLQPYPAAQGKKNQVTAFVVDLCFIWMYLAGLTIWLVSALNLSVNTGIVLLLAAGITVLWKLAAEVGKSKKWILFLVWGVLLVLTAAIGQKMWLGGMHQICNSAIDALGRRFPYLLPSYGVAVTDSMKVPALYGAIGWLLFLVVPGTGYLVEKGNRMFLGIQMAGLLLLQMITGVGSGFTGFLCSFFCFLAVWIRGHAERVTAGTQRLATVEMIVGVAVLGGILLTGGYVLAENVLPQDGTVLSQWKETLVQKVEDYRYKGNSKVLPDGQFQNLSSFEPEKKEVLKITMSQPQSYYLRGFTGSVYTDDGWEGEDSAKLWENRDLFYWLHQDGFYGQEILGKAAAALDAEVAAADKNTITVENLAGNSHYCYTPYELANPTGDPVQNLLDAQKIGDSGILNGGIRGERTYTYQAYPALITKYPSYTATLLDTEHLSAAGKDYQKLEEYYNAFAYDNYLDMPEQMQRECASLLGSYERKDGEKHADYAEAKQNILYLLTTEYTDSDKLDETWNGADFIYEFLEISKKGYSVHFASAATMMFRYYGIPARYVEGYLVTPQDAEAMTAGEPYTLDDTHAHAWVEYYQDGVGWLPFETTPSYLDIMNRADEYQDISGLSGGGSQNQNQQDEEQEQEEEQDEEPDHMIDWIQVLIVLLIIGIVLLLLTMLVFLIWILVQRRKSRQLKKRFTSEDPREAICSMYEYTMNILSAAGLKIRNTSLYRYEKQITKMFDEETGKEYHRIVDIRQEAVYSRNSLTEEQKQEMMEFKEKIWKRIYANGTWIQKMQLKYIYFL